MELLPWIEKYSVGNKEIDAQHKKIVKLINELHESMKEGRGKEKIGKVLQDLINYTSEHFAAEEKMLISVKYPGLNEQISEHKRLVQQVKEYQSNFLNGNAMMTMELNQFLKSWLVNHIMGTDMRYKDYVK